VSKLYHVSPLYLPPRCSGVDLGSAACRALIAARGVLIVCVPGQSVWDGRFSPRRYDPMHLFGFRKRNSAGDVETLYLRTDLRIRWRGTVGVHNMYTILTQDARVPEILVKTWFKQPLLTLADDFGREVLNRKPFVAVDWKAWK